MMPWFVVALVALVAVIVGGVIVLVVLFGPPSSLWK